MADKEAKVAEWAELSYGWGLVVQTIHPRLSAKLDALALPGNTPDIEAVRKLQGWIECAQWVMALPESEIRRIEEGK